MSIKFLIAQRDSLKVISDRLFGWWDSNEKSTSTFIVWQKHFLLEQKIQQINKEINKVQLTNNNLKLEL